MYVYVYVYVYVLSDRTRALDSEDPAADQLDHGELIVPVVVRWAHGACTPTEEYRE